MQHVAEKFTEQVLTALSVSFKSIFETAKTKNTYNWKYVTLQKVKCNVNGLHILLN